jgi:hypothetical protein
MEKNFNSERHPSTGDPAASLAAPCGTGSSCAFVLFGLAIFLLHVARKFPFGFAAQLT